MDPYADQTYLPPSSSQIQPQNQLTQEQYLYNQQYNQAQQYTYYPQPPQPQEQQYSNAVYQQQPEQEHAPIQPPGVQIQPESTHVAAYQHAYGQPDYQNDPYAYYYYQQQQQQQLGYTDPGTVQVQQDQQQWQQQQAQTGDYGLISAYPSNAQAQYSAPVKSGPRPSRGGGSSSRGRGRGRGRGGGSSSSIRPAQPPRMAWCELCRVDCNTQEILENHKNGKKHKKNLKIQEELQNLAIKTHEAQMAPKVENSSFQGLTNESQQAASEEGSGLKRKISDESGKPVDPNKKPKEIVPFICELCNVTCGSAPTFDNHLKGKKHMFNLQQFQEQQATMGQAALQALYPALQLLYPVLQALAQPTIDASTSSANGGLDPQVLQLLQPFLPQTGPMVAPTPALVNPGSNPGGAQEALTNGANENKVEPVNKIEALESKTETLVEPSSKF